MIEKNKPEKAAALFYFGEFSETEIEVINVELRKAEISLHLMNKAGRPQASLEDFLLTTFLAISPVLMNELLNGVLSGAAWDAIKFSTKYIWNKLKGRRFQRYSSLGKEDVELKFGVNAILDKNTQYNFDFTGLDEKNMLDALDKVLKFLENQSLKSTYEHPDYVYYSPEDKDWIKVNVMEEIRKQMKDRRDLKIEKVIPSEKKNSKKVKGKTTSPKEKSKQKKPKKK